MYNNNANACRLDHALTYAGMRVNAWGPGRGWRGKHGDRGQALHATLQLHAHRFAKLMAHSTARIMLTAVLATMSLQYLATCVLQAFVHSGCQV